MITEHHLFQDTKVLSPFAPPSIPEPIAYPIIGFSSLRRLHGSTNLFVFTFQYFWFCLTLPSQIAYFILLHLLWKQFGF